MKFDYIPKGVKNETSVDKEVEEDVVHPVCEATLKTALEALNMVYKANVAYLQVNNREQEYIEAIEDIDALLNS